MPIATTYPQVTRFISLTMSTSAISSEANDAGQALWQSCIDLLAQELPEQQFNTWIKPLQAIISDDFSKLTIVVINRFKLDWIRAQYAARISVLLNQLYGQPIQLDFALLAKEAPVKTAPVRTAFESEDFLNLPPSSSQDLPLKRAIDFQ